MNAGNASSGGSERHVAWYRVVLNVVCDKAKKKKQNGSIPILIPFWITLLLLEGIGRSLHENALEWNAERGRRIVLVVGTVRHGVRVVSYNTNTIITTRMAVSSSSPHFGLLCFYSKELDDPYMKMH